MSCSVHRESVDGCDRCKARDLRGVGPVIQGDCLEVMQTLPDNSIDLICTDPPYFKVKADWWDRQWETPEGFLTWLDKVAEQWQRLLKPNGSLYCFASPKMSARVEVMLSDRFCVLNNIRWGKDAGWHQKAKKEEARQYQNPWESIIFCEHYGADNIAKGEAGYGAKCDELRGFVFEPLRDYLATEWEMSGVSRATVNSILESSLNGGGGMASHYFSRKTSQWELPTAEHYTKLQQAFPGYFTRPYQELRSQYDELRSQYEELRRPFSVSADVPYTDVWTFPTVASYPGKHPCEKPSTMLEHIITASSRPDAVVLDCFAGSGSTLAAAKNLGREPIGIEIDPHWATVCRHRLGDFSTVVPSLEDRVQWLETQTQSMRNVRSPQPIKHQQLSLL